MRIALTAVVPTSMPINVAVAKPPPPKTLPFACPIFYSFSTRGRVERMALRRTPVNQADFSDMRGAEMSKRSSLGLFAAAALTVAALTVSAEAGPKVAVITPYLAQPGTQFYVEGFQAAAKAKGWEVNVI